MTFIVLNGDGIEVGAYETIEHANGAARDLAAAAREGGDTTNFYSVTDREGNAVDGGEEHPRMRAGFALRQQWAHERAAAQLCACGHPVGGHRELQPTRAVVDGEIVETPHPDYKPLLFECGAEGCDCRVQR